MLILIAKRTFSFSRRIGLILLRGITNAPRMQNASPEYRLSVNGSEHHAGWLSYVSGSYLHPAVIGVLINYEVEMLIKTGGLPRCQSPIQNASALHLILPYKTRGSVMTSMSEKLDSQAAARVGQACNRCRKAKARCDGRRPCRFCERHSIECIYESRQRTRGPGRRLKSFVHSF
ncbi:hypothetical protein F5Y18DRAFT_309655 [Xylariaceae sp. FL1019]|nr:hypothetical protein F5Y18DRAFT_309655 [Xylariaceae sp. FL1019]